MIGDGRRTVTAPEQALTELAAQLRGEHSIVSELVIEPATEPVLGLLGAAGPRAAAAPGEYALLVESVREGYLLHYAEPRVIAAADRDLALLAGDYLYALGLERLAALGDLEAVRELADLISLAAQVHDGARDGPRRAREAGCLWLATVVAITAGGGLAHEAAKGELRSGGEAAAGRLWATARAVAAEHGLDGRLRLAAQAIDCSPEPPS